MVISLFESAAIHIETRLYAAYNFVNERLATMLSIPLHIRFLWGCDNDVVWSRHSTPSVNNADYGGGETESLSLRSFIAQ